MRKIRLTALLLLVSMLAAMTACGSDNTAAETTAQVTETAETTAAETEPELKPDLPNVKFDGKEFTFLNGNTAAWMTTFVVTAEEENGDTVNDAIYKRNLTVAEKYDVVIKEISTKSARADFSAAVTAGDKYFDTALMVSADAHNITLEGTAMDFGDIPYIDVYKPWWIEGSVKDFSIMDHVFYAISEFDTTHYDGVRIMYFNKIMADKYNIESPYQLVYDGKWTLDKLLELGMKVVSDLNGDSQLGAGDQFGYTSYDSIGGQTLMTASGVFPSLIKDADDLPVLAMNTEENLSKLIKITNMLSQNEGFLNPGQTSSTSGGVPDFIAGRVLFYNETLGNINKLREMEDDFGIIPAPKYNEEQDEYYSLGGNPYFMIVPITTPDLEKTGVIMEALAYESVGIIDTAFYDVFLRDKLSRDEDSPKMLDIIFGNLTYYYPLARTYVCGNIASRMWKGDADYASYFAQNESTIQSLIDNALVTYKELINK